MRSKSVAQIGACLILGICVSIPATAQKMILPGTNTQTSVAPSRVVERVDDTRLVKLTGNIHPMARSEFDQGVVDPQLPLERMQLVLKRSPEQEAALEQFIAEQYDPKSANFHHWLEPEEFGKLYGPSDSDIAAITSWLQNHGFQIYQVSKGRVTIEFSGTADQIQQTFHTELHNYLVDGKKHIANNQDPQIPEALAPVITGIASLHNFFPVHQSVMGRYVKRDKTGKITPVDPVLNGPNPEYGFTDQNGQTEEDITPYDFAAIYNLTPLWNAGITGAGQTIAISAVTDIVASDVTTFRSSFGLSGFKGTVTQIHNGTDPGVVTADQVENTLDTEWSGATAPDANVVVVVSASTSTTFGGDLSDSYIVDNPKTALTMSASYGECEAGLGNAGNASINAIYQQGASEGISMFESSGDQGSTGCDNSDATTFPAAAKYGLQVNGDASSPYITAVGGTDFAWQTSPYATYWNSPNAATGASAKGYIPEIPWNGTCSSDFLLQNLFTKFSTTEAVCNAAVTAGETDLVKVTGGSGGVSACTNNTGTTLGTCKNGYAKPSWQTGAGVPSDGARDLPDVSLFASSGYPEGIAGSAYLICVASNSPEKSCDYTNSSFIVYQEVGGTSVSSPAMAGIMALVLQKQNGAAQGLANPVFYKLAANDNLTNCNSNTAASGNTCNFYDITTGTNAQVCTTGSLNCVTSTSGDAYGIVSGYNSTTGYDLTTGLGSVNAANLVNNWATAAGALATITLSPSTLTFTSAAEGTTSAAQTVTVQNTGSATATLTSETLTGTDASSFVISANTCGASLLASATCTVSVEFKPAAAGTLTASLSVADNATGSPQKITLTGTGTATSATTVSLSPATLTYASTTEGSTSAAQTVTLKNTGTTTATLTSETLTGTDASSYLISANTCGASLASNATCAVSIEFKPVATGTLTASLSVADNATGSPQTITLTGTGAASATAVSLSPVTLTFASATEGSTSAAQAVTVKNIGTGAVTLTSETLTGTNASSFVISANTCGASLASNATCTVSVEFNPAAAGTLTASLSVADNASGSPQTVSLTGTGTVASTLAVSLSPTTLTFASTTQGSTSAAQVVTVSNTGNSTLTLTSETLTGTNASSYLISANTCGSSLAASATCAVSIEFTPAAAGTLTASLSVADNASGSPQTVGLTGTGAAAATGTYSLSAAAVNVAPGASGMSTITATGAGGYTGTITLSSCTVATAPTGATDVPSCTISGATISIASGSTTGTGGVTIGTTAATAAVKVGQLDKRSKSWPWTGAGSVVLAGFLLLGIPARRRNWKSLLGMFLFIAMLGTISACGGGSGGGGGGGGNGNPGTTAGTYTFTVSGQDANGVKATATVTVTVS